MEEHINRFKAAVTAVLGAMTALWGWYGWVVAAWIFAMALDYITGTCAALAAGEWSSKEARQGIWHKTGSIVVVLIASVLDMMVSMVIGHFPAVSLPFTYTGWLGPLAVVWYIITEAGSIVENAGKLGAPVPGWLKKAIAAFQTKIDETAEKEE